MKARCLRERSVLEWPVQEGQDVLDTDPATA